MEFIGLFIWFVIVGTVIVGAMSKAGGKRQQQYRKHQQMQQAQAAMMNAANKVRDSVQNTYRAPQDSGSYQTPQQTQRRTMTDADRAKLEAYRRQKAAAGGNAYVPSSPVQSNQTLNANRQRNIAQPNIVERAKTNSQKFAGKDATLNELEAEHRHSERVGTAVADYVAADREAHRKMHEEPLPRVEDESYLGSVEDLMVKGYDGNLSFERDFIGEAQDMLSTFTLP